LINLIRTTIDPDGWDDTNGDGTIQAFVPNLSLIVSQTQAVQDQIQDLLKQLRELNDVQIVVEVRFVSLADAFFERIGVDFDFNINDNSGLDPNAIPEEVNPSSTVGLTNSDQAGPAFTPDLDIPYRQGSFVSSTPLFGGFDPGSAASFGFAILSDIEVFFLLNAAKGDARTNITQAPTVTMFNGQVASVNDGAQVPFVTSVTPVVGDFAVAQQPIITLLPEGASLNVQGTVSHDRKSVRMTLVPFFSQITNVDTFTFDGSRTTQRASDENFIDDLINSALGMDPDEEEPPVEIETTTQGVTVQLPTLGFTTVSTVVSVPDGGTILIGGVKRQSEQRLERGVPFLSNVPYISRLFKNVGIGRETSSLMMMVTPRIIIQQEEEEDQVGTVN
jgi:general secretion pathway protein D